MLRGDLLAIGDDRAEELLFKRRFFMVYSLSIAIYFW